MANVFEAMTNKELLSVQTLKRLIPLDIDDRLSSWAIEVNVRLSAQTFEKDEINLAQEGLIEIVLSQHDLWEAESMYPYIHSTRDDENEILDDQVAAALWGSTRNSFLTEDSDLKTYVTFVTSANVLPPCMQWLRDLNAASKLLHNRKIDGIYLAALGMCHTMEKAQGDP